jgi:hypothetical protein
MGEYVGVKGVADINVPMLKQCALLFSRIAVPGAREIKVSEVAGELEWLQDQGIVFDPQFTEEQAASLRDNPKVAHFYRLEIKEHHEYIKQLVTVVQSDESLDSDSPLSQSPELYRIMQTIQNATVRSVSIELRELYQIEAHPLLSNDSLSPTTAQIEKTGVIQIVLRTLPIPHDLTPWEQIIEYRSDTDSQHKWLDLRNWMGEVARGELTPVEVEDKLEHLISQYQRHMKLHKMKANQGVIQTILVSSAELAENLIKFKWGQIAKNLFSIKQRNIALMEGELTSPGSEVA